jgi:hypothetical protein
MSEIYADSCKQIFKKAAYRLAIGVQMGMSSPEDLSA